MGLRFKSVVGALVLLGASAAVGTEVAIAQRRPLGLAEQFERAFFGRSGPAYDNRSILDQIRLYVLPFTYPENRITGEAERIHELYERVIEVQSSSDPIIRTPDLSNPFSESLLTLPSYPPSESPLGANVGSPQLPELP